MQNMLRGPGTWNKHGLLSVLSHTFCTMSARSFLDSEFTAFRYHSSCVHRCSNGVRKPSPRAYPLTNPFTTIRLCKTPFVGAWCLSMQPRTDLSHLEPLLPFWFFHCTCSLCSFGTDVQSFIRLLQRLIWTTLMDCRHHRMCFGQQESCAPFSVLNMKQKNVIKQINWSGV